MDGKIRITSQQLDVKTGKVQIIEEWVDSYDHPPPDPEPRRWTDEVDALRTIVAALSARLAAVEGKLQGGRT